MPGLQPEPPRLASTPGPASDSELKHCKVLFIHSVFAANDNDVDEADQRLGSDFSPLCLSSRPPRTSNVSEISGFQH